MKKPMQKVTFSLLGTAMGILIMAAPLTSTVYAAEAPSTTISNYTKDHQHHDQHDKDTWDRHDHHWSHTNFARHHMAIYHEWQISNQIDGSLENPVDVVMAVADVLGFDVNTDTFNLISQDGLQSVVQVVHNGTAYNIIVEHPLGGSWTVTAMDPIQ